MSCLYEEITVVQDAAVHFSSESKILRNWQAITERWNGPNQLDSGDVGSRVSEFGIADSKDTRLVDHFTIAEHYGIHRYVKII